LITGKEVCPDRTGPSPLLLPATAINTTFSFEPERKNQQSLITHHSSPSPSLSSSSLVSI
jgi:hypothetical protein